MALSCVATVSLTSAAVAANRGSATWTGPTGNVVALIDAERPDEVLGSGVMFPGGKVLTRCSAIEQADRLEVWQRANSSVANLTYEDRKRDLCELEVTRPERFRPVALKLRAVQDVVDGEPIYAVGAADGGAKIVSGHVVKVQNENTDHVILISARLAASYSGGALFDESGALLGILHHRDRSTRKLSYAHPAQYALLRKPGKDQAAAGPVKNSQPQAGASAPGSEKNSTEDYLLRLAEASRTGVKYPEEARSQGWSGTTTIRFDIEAGGELRESFVDVSSGYAALDVTALIAVRKAISELPMPEQTKKKGLKGTVSITFELAKAGQKE